MCKKSFPCHWSFNKTKSSFEGKNTWTARAAWSLSQQNIFYYKAEQNETKCTAKGQLWSANRGGKALLRKCASFWGNPSNSLQHLVPVCLGAALVKNLGTSLGARKSQGFQVSVGESASLGLASWGRRIAGLPATVLRTKERVSQSSRRVCCMVNLNLKVCAWDKHFH